MSYLTSGFCEVIMPWQMAGGFRTQVTTQAFAIVGWDPGDIDNLSALWADYIQGSGLPSTSVVHPVTVRVGTSDPSAPLVYSGTNFDVGTGANTVIPPNTSVLATKRTLLGGRKGRGRLFLPPPPEGQVNNIGVLDSSYVDGLQDLVDTMMTAMESELGGAPYLLHTDPSPAPTLIQSISVEQVVATQRRRLRP